MLHFDRRAYVSGFPSMTAGKLERRWDGSPHVASGTPGLHLGELAKMKFAEH